MKTCRNCRTIWPDEYAGTCTDCGAGMGSVTANSTEGGKDLASIYARQRRSADAEAGLEQTLRSGGHGNVPVNEKVKQAALALLIPKPGAFTDDED